MHGNKVKIVIYIRGLRGPHKTGLILVASLVFIKSLARPVSISPSNLEIDHHAIYAADNLDDR